MDMSPLLLYRCVHTVLQDAWKTNCDAVRQQKMMASYHCHAL